MAGPLAPDRRQRRRLETIEEILDVAVTVMDEEGAGGFSLGEVARRMGIQPPSIYGYFDSKNALYDAVFARGWATVNAVMAPFEQQLDHTDDPHGFPLAMAQMFVRWAVEHPAYAQLMFWRPVPGWAPSPQAYAPAVQSLGRAREQFVFLQRRGVLHADIDLDAAISTWTVLISGVISQQLSNAPHQTFEEGAFSRLLPQLVSMYLAQYGAERSHDDNAGATGARSRADADKPHRRRRGGDAAMRGDAGAVAPAG